MNDTGRCVIHEHYTFTDFSPEVRIHRTIYRLPTSPVKSINRKYWVVPRTERVPSEWLTYPTQGPTHEGIVGHEVENSVIVLIVNKVQ